MIGRSKEDVERINQVWTKVRCISQKLAFFNQELLNSSSHLAPPTSRVPDDTDQDYDFPATEDHEQEDYDEPCPVLPETNPPDDQEEDYDEPQPVLPNCSSPVKAEKIQINIQAPSLDVQEDYDEPQPVIPARAFQQRVQQNDQSPESEPDYDEPVLSHRTYMHDSD